MRCCPRSNGAAAPNIQAGAAQWASATRLLMLHLRLGSHMELDIMQGVTAAFTEKYHYRVNSSERLTVFDYAGA